MADNQRPSSPYFTHIDVTTAHSSNEDGKTNGEDESLKDVLRQMVIAQDRQNELMEELIEQMSAAQRQRSAELAQWKQSNPHLARQCKRAAETLGKVQGIFLEQVAEEINENSEDLLDGEFVMNEFVDRFGPRMAHLNGVLQVLSQLSANG